MITIWTDYATIENENGEPMTPQEQEDYFEYTVVDVFNSIATENEIICIADIGCWDGIKHCHKLFGHRVGNIFRREFDGMCHWYVANKNLRGTESHHDGRNDYCYRMLKGETHDEQIENCKRLFSKPLTSARITRYTMSLYPVIKD